MKRRGNLASKAVAARAHITNIRNTKFSIGSKLQNPPTRDLHNAVTRLTSELYAKDVHFLMELIQNAEDNKYPSTVEPALEFVFIKEDITGIGAPATLLVFNNEVGFSKEDIDSLCSIGQSTKKAKRSQGFIGEKGIGFKSVFLVSSHAYIFSNGYHIRFCEVPNGDCGIGYIVPEWINERPSTADLERIYGNSVLPTTTIILPLKAEKVEAVKNELLQIHPEVLLFLQKIKRLAVRGEHGSSSKGSVSVVSIVNETTLVPSSNQVLDSRVVELSAQQGSKEMSLDTCRYYLHKQIFPIKTGIIVEERKGVKELMICLAFPFGKRLKGGASAAGIFAFLPTGMVTNFPFIIHSDFVLASSREAILMDNRWNLGSLERVPSAYVQALVTCLNSVTKSHVLDFLPTKESPFPELNRARDSIKLMLQSECIVPCESFSDDQIVLCRPSNALVICPKFRRILAKAKQNKIALGAVSSQMKRAIHDSVDNEKYAETWRFLGVAPANCSYDWYLKFIKTSFLLSRASEDMYMDIIFFLADNWALFPKKSVSSMLVLKYVIWSGDSMLCSVLQIQQQTLKIRIVWEADEHAWLSNWNREIGCPNDVFFCPDYLVNSLVKGENQENLKKWFSSTAGVVITDTFKYCMELIIFIREDKDPGMVISLTHFVYFSTMKKNYIKYHDMQRLLRFLPVVEKSGKVNICSRSLVPAATSSWTRLFGLINPLSVESDNLCLREQHDLCHHNDMEDTRQNCGYYSELGDVYSAAAEFNGETIAENELLNFLVKNEKAFDLPYASPPNTALKLASNELTCEQALLLLKWIRNLRLGKQCELPARFSESIKSTKWLKTHAGFRCPKRCYLLCSVENKSILDLGRKLKVLSAIDEVYYSPEIRSYIKELKFIGVQVKTETMSELIIPHVKRRASSIIDPALAILLLDFIKHLRENNRLYGGLKKNLQEGKWLKTVNGYACPFGSVLVASFEQAIGQITSLHVVDTAYYGNKLHRFLDELKFLGVVVDMEEVYKLICINFRFPEDLSCLTVDSVFLLLECIRSVGPASFCANHDVRCKAWIKTNLGFMRPSETILSDSNLLDLADVLYFTFIDESYYGIKIKSYKAELEAVGVTVGLESAEELVVNRLKSDISHIGLSAIKVISLLRLFKSAKILMPSFVANVVSFFSGERWVKTKHDYQYAVDSILFDSEWATISQLVDLPFIDETFYGAEICSLKDELKILGVVVNLRDGLHFVVHGLKFQEDPSLVTDDAAFSILQCLESLINSNVSSDKILLEELLHKLRVSECVKTHMGYRLPSETLLFNVEWKYLLRETDGPFINRAFYKKITSEQNNVLRVVGVQMDIADVCSWIVKNITCHFRTNPVKRIYKFLKKFHWIPKPEDCFTHQLWIPDQQDNSRGKWVDNVDCVVHDEGNLFGHCLYSLDNYYEEGLLPFLQSAFNVPEFPSLDHYAALWKFWCETAEEVSVEKVKLFWVLLSRNCDADFWRDEEKIQSTFTRLPAVDASRENIQLLQKEEVYIGDDLQLKKAFTESSKDPLFVWFSKDNSISYYLHSIYTTIGVKDISESVEYSVSGLFQKMEKYLIGKPLLKLVMAYLASSSSGTPANERHSMVKDLCDIPTFGTDEPLQVKYYLQLPLSRKCLHAKIHKKVFFDGRTRRFLIHTPSWCNTENDIQLINDFARAISEAVFMYYPFQDLIKLLKMGFTFLLTGHDIDELIMSENLEVSVGDQELLDELFSPVVIPSSRKLHVANAVEPSTPLQYFKRRRYK